MVVVSGKALVYGDKIDTDVIIPAKYLVYTDPQILGQHAMEGIDPEFPRKASQGVILVAGRAFGMGSSREQAAIALKAAGVRAVLAESIARIFYRNAINVGLPVARVPGITRLVREGDLVEADFENGVVRVNGVEVARFPPMRGIALEILKMGGLSNYVKKVIG